MPIPFIAETLKVIRRRVGALLYDNMTFAAITTLAGSTTTQAIAEMFKRYQDGTYVGRNIYQCSSTEQREIATHVQATGTVTWAPTLTSISVGEEMEVWPSEVSPTDVRDAI